jgi:hypothetical protein
MKGVDGCHQMGAQQFITKRRDFSALFRDDHMRKDRDMKFQLSEMMQNEDLEKLIERLTGTKIALDTTALDDLNLEFEKRDPIESAAFASFMDAVRAAFCAGMAVGINPSLVLFSQAGAMGNDEP